MISITEFCEFDLNWVPEPEHMPALEAAQRTPARRIGICAKPETSGPLTAALAIWRAVTVRDNLTILATSEDGARAWMCELEVMLARAASSVRNRFKISECKLAAFIDSMPNDCAIVHLDPVALGLHKTMDAAARRPLTIIMPDMGRVSTSIVDATGVLMQAHERNQWILVCK